MSSVVGYGVFANRFIPKGTITWVFDDLDQVIPTARLAGIHPALHDLVDKYSYLNGRGERILCWDHSRFINHSCSPTSLAPGFDLEIAVRDIQDGEELTDDYGLLNLQTSFVCACGYKQCRGTVGPGDATRYSEKWDALLAAAFPLIKDVEQPLWDLVREKDEVTSVLAGEAPLPSCRVHELGVMHAVARPKL